MGAESTGIYALAQESTPGTVSEMDTSVTDIGAIFDNISGTIIRAAQAVKDTTVAVHAIENDTTKATKTPTPKKPSELSPIMAIGVGVLLSLVLSKLFRAK